MGLAGPEKFQRSKDERGTWTTRFPSRLVTGHSLVRPSLTSLLSIHPVYTVSSMGYPHPCRKDPYYGSVDTLYVSYIFTMSSWIIPYKNEMLPIPARFVGPEEIVIDYTSRTFFMIRSYPQWDFWNPRKTFGKVSPEIDSAPESSQELEGMRSPTPAREQDFSCHF